MPLSKITLSRGFEARRFTASAFPLKRAVFDHRCGRVLDALALDLEQFYAARFDLVAGRTVLEALGLEQRVSLFLKLGFAFPVEES